MSKQIRLYPPPEEKTCSAVAGTAAWIETVLPTVVCVLLPACLFLFYWCTRPFASQLTSQSVSLSGLSQEQRLNIEQASRSLNNIVIQPHQVFSFNSTVGPRTRRRGYLGAPSYIGADTDTTLGGGICLVSSVLYQNALAAGLTIKERTAHLRPIATIAPGLDATVWYGQTDLRFINANNFPVQIKTDYSPERITVRLTGSPAADWHLRTLSRSERKVGPDQLQVEVFSSTGDKKTLVSQDVYRLNKAGESRR